MRAGQVGRTRRGHVEDTSWTGRGHVGKEHRTHRPPAHPIATPPSFRLTAFRTCWLLTHYIKHAPHAPPPRNPLTPPVPVPQVLVPPHARRLPVSRRSVLAALRVHGRLYVRRFPIRTASTVYVAQLHSRTHTTQSTHSSISSVCECRLPSLTRERVRPSPMRPIGSKRQHSRAASWLAVCVGAHARVVGLLSSPTLECARAALPRS